MAGELDRQVLRQQIAQVFVQFDTLPLVGVIGGTLLLLLMWHNVDQSRALIWYAGVWILYMGFIPLTSYIEKRLPESRKYADASRRRAMTLCVMDGAIWGVTAFMLHAPESVFHQMALLTFVIGAASVGSITYISYRPTFYAQLFPILIPFVLKFAFSTESQYPLVAVCIAFYMAILIWFNRFLYAAFAEALYLRFKLNEQKEVAEKARASQTQFFAAASHDLRQPLHAYGLLASSLRRLVPDREGQQILDTMSSSMGAMRDLLNTLLDISKLDAGAMQPKLERFDIKLLLEKLFLEYESEAAERGISLAFRSMSLSVVSDKMLLERILRNLLSNSIHYTEHGTVILAARFLKGGVRVEVRDSGPGIAEEFHEVIFKEYERIGGTDGDKGVGMGLGLAIVQRLSGLLGMPLGFRSKLGEGSVFYVDLPAAQGGENPVQSKGAEEFVNLSGKKVVVVDDNDTVKFALRFLLQGWGGEVVEFSSGSELFESLPEMAGKPDLFIVDYRLPGETGVEVIERLGRHYGHLPPALLITGDTSVEKVHNFSSLTFPVLYKPVAPDDLRREIAHLLVGRSHTSH